MYEESYANGAGKSSSGSKDKVKAGSPDARKPYMKDMYDMKPPMPSASKPMDSAGMTDKVTAEVAVDPDMGSKHYGKGNPYKKKAKAKFKSFKELRDYASKMEM